MGTVQDGNKGYFVGWYIDQKVGYDELRGVRATSPPWAEKGGVPRGKQIRKEIIAEAVKIKSQPDTSYYPQPLQTPYVTNTINHQPQLPYYHSTHAHNYGQSSNKAP